MIPYIVTVLKRVDALISVQTNYFRIQVQFQRRWLEHRTFGVTAFRQKCHTILALIIACNNIHKTKTIVISLSDEQSRIY